VFVDNERRLCDHTATSSPLKLDEGAERRHKKCFFLTLVLFLTGTQFQNSNYLL